MMRDITTALAVVGLLACMWFVTAYWWTTGGDWRRTAAGRHLMAFTANLGVLLALIVLARLWPTYPGREPIVLVAFAGLVVQLVRRCVLLHTAQREPAARR